MRSPWKTTSNLGVNEIFQKYLEHSRGFWNILEVDYDIRVAEIQKQTHIPMQVNAKWVIKNKNRT
jgi:hypothetical protein